MPKRKPTPKNEPDSVYFLKLVIYVILGAFWIHFKVPVHIGDFSFYGFPLGFFIGLLFAAHDHFQIDRKVEYAILLVMAVLGFVIPYVGVFI